MNVYIRLVNNCYTLKCIQIIFDFIKVFSKYIRAFYIYIMIIRQ